MRLEPKIIGKAVVRLTRYTTRPTPFEWQSDPYIWIASGQVYQ